MAFICCFILCSSSTLKYTLLAIEMPSKVPECVEDASQDDMAGGWQELGTVLQRLQTGQNLLGRVLDQVIIYVPTYWHDAQIDKL